MKKDWFRLKRYPHIGPLLNPKDKLWVQQYVKNQDKIATHSFYPLIHRRIKVRRFRRPKETDGIRKRLRQAGSKNREVYYCNHLDSNIYGYYANLLSNAYEQKLRRRGINECVTAYRRIRVSKGNGKTRNKSSIDFAADLFSYIKCQSEESLAVIKFDIKNFFDSLDHNLLKRSWMDTIETTDGLSKDHYNLFKNITKYSYVEENALFNLFKKKILVKKKNNKVTPKSIVKKKYLRNQSAFSYCDKRSIETIRKNGLIKSNKYVSGGEGSVLRKKGIPQGLPISSVLANIYMTEFDVSVNNLLKGFGGIYRRYSDDMVAICKFEYVDVLIQHFERSIKKFKLEIQDSKTQVYRFDYNDELNRYFCSELNMDTGNLNSNSNFEYLGFQFDGYFTLLKNSSLSKYYRRMKRAVARAKYYAVHNKTKNRGKLFKTRLYKKFTFKGSQRRKLYTRDKKDKHKYIFKYKYDWGNFLTYAYMAARIIPDNKIKGQLRRHWRKFQELIQFELP